MSLRKHKYKARLQELRAIIERRYYEMLPENFQDGAGLVPGWKFAKELLDWFDRDDVECNAADPREKEKEDRRKWRHYANVGLCWCADCLWSGTRKETTYPGKSCPKCGSKELKPGTGPVNEASGQE